MVLNLMHVEVSCYGLGKNVIFGADMSWSVPIDNKKKDFLILDKNGLYDTKLTAKKEYSINFTEKQRKFCFSLHYNRSKSYIFGNCADINADPLCLGNVSKDFSVDNIKDWIIWLCLWFFWWLWCCCCWYFRYS